MARAGQAAAQAGTISPSRSGRRSTLAWICAVLDALDAEGALLHHPAGPHRDLGVEDQGWGSVV